MIVHVRHLNLMKKNSEFFKWYDKKRFRGLIPNALRFLFFKRNNSKIETKNNINFNVFVLEIIPKKRRKFSL